MRIRPLTFIQSTVFQVLHCQLTFKGIPQCLTDLNLANETKTRLRESHLITGARRGKFANFSNLLINLLILMLL